MHNRCSIHFNNMNQCTFFIARKHRHCKFDALEGHKFCKAHLEDDPDRVKCPYGNHTVPKSQLEKHIKNCNEKLQKDQQSGEKWHVANINAGTIEGALPPATLPPPLQGEPDSIGRRRLALAVQLGPDYFKSLLERIDKASQDLEIKHPVVSSELEPQETAAYLLNEDRAANKSFDRRHALQHVSIAGNMQRYGILPVKNSNDSTKNSSKDNDGQQEEEEVMYVELGAGKGYLSLLFATCYNAQKIALVDVQGFRLKADRSMREIKQLVRIRCDLVNFNVSGLPGLENNEPWVSIGKHLCGAATDLALRCCLNDALAQSSPKPSKRFRGLALSTCCHHRCSYQHFVGRDIITDELGFSPEDFELISWMTGWALCGHDAPAPQPEADSSSGNDDDEDDNDNSFNGTEGWRPHKSLSRSQRIAMGQNCKSLLDAVRIEWLQRQGFSAECVYYVQPTVTGENRLILAKPPS